MNDPAPSSCPRCGSRQLVSSSRGRKVYINHAGERIPLLTANFSLDHPVFEERATTLTCSCEWRDGNA